MNFLLIATLFLLLVLLLKIRARRKRTPEEQLEHNENCFFGGLGPEDFE